MSEKKSISLSSSILINLNIMISAGVFINSILLSKKLGYYSSIIYLLIGCFIFPLIYSISKLLSKYPINSFYEFASPLSSFASFFSGWSFFWGKLASGSLILYVGCNFLKKTTYLLNFFSATQLCIFIIFLFWCLNCLKIENSIFIQKLFLIAKSIPIFIVLFLGSYKFNLNFNLENYNFYSIITTIPLVLYCFSGFETACSISRKLKNPEKNGPKSIAISFITAIILYTAFQTLIFNLIKNNLNACNSYSDLFPAICSNFNINPFIKSKIELFCSALISISCIGGSYGIMFSNAWNFYTLAENKHLFFSNYFIKLNKNNIPFLIISIESLIYCFFLFFTAGNQILLQQTAVFGITITYCISCIAFLVLSFRSNNLKDKIISSCAVLTCVGFILSCIISFINYGLSSLLLFVTILLFGLINFFYKKANLN